MVNKIISVVLSILISSSVVFLISSCNKKSTGDLTTTSSFFTMEIDQFSTTDNASVQPTNNSESDIGGGIITVQKYRDAFYSVPAPFVSLVGKEIFFAWRETIDATSTAETMVMSQFIQRFNITREQFDKANLEWAKGIRDNLDGVPCINPKDYANQITDEVFNGDIIFSFDDDLIREYYLSPDYPYLYDIEFEEAVARGEYTPRTEVWVDVEAMEAEIIAKYGEAEIIPEEPTDIPEVTDALPQESESTQITEAVTI